MKTLRTNLVVLVLFGLTAAIGCEEEDVSSGCEGEEMDVGEVNQEVQYAYNGKHFGYDYNSFVTNTTGALFCPKKKNGSPWTVGDIPVRTTCGVTFVSPHYAITAAHCVNGDHCGGETLTVESYKISGLDTTAASQARQLYTTGYNAWPKWIAQNRLTSADNYKVTTYTSCTVIARCGDFGGEYDPGNYCRFGNAGDFTADIALIRCADRSSSATYMPVAQTEKEREPICMHWPHEVVDGQEMFDDGTPLWDHYTAYNGGTALDENYHYLGPIGMKSYKQLLPLSSRPWFNSPIRPRRTVKAVADSDGDYMWTDLFGCHGSSGSGVMKMIERTHYLLGPIRTGNGWWSSSRLCVKTGSSDYKPLGEVLSYTQLKYTQALADAAYMLDGVPGGAQFYIW
ncbi:MAG: hypothetical protein GY854_08400 [Deltaproteobacteria bacterium]|nr:hypothetical protein [Deltaproteobacteria bacterium]